MTVNSSSYPRQRRILWGWRIRPRVAERHAEQVARGGEPPRVVAALSVLERSWDIFNLLTQKLHDMAGIRLHVGETRTVEQSKRNARTVHSDGDSVVAVLAVAGAVWRACCHFLSNVPPEQSATYAA